MHLNIQGLCQLKPFGWKMGLKDKGFNSLIIEGPEIMISQGRFRGSKMSWRIQVSFQFAFLSLSSVSSAGTAGWTSTIQMLTWWCLVKMWVGFPCVSLFISEKTFLLKPTKLPWPDFYPIHNWIKQQDVKWNENWFRCTMILLPGMGDNSTKFYSASKE